mgnify:CR=1 FL=1|jgi:uncharacterized protein (TIGR02147 family)
MSVFDYSDYKEFVNSWISEQPKGGHGQLRHLAKSLDVNSVVMSQVFRGNRELSLEHALSVAQFMGLSNIERDFFLLLVQKSRAGSFELKRVLEEQIESHRAKSQNLKNRVKHEAFSENDKATFYSQWYYSAIRLGVSIEGLGSIGAIANYLNLNRALVAKVVEFLLENRLIVEEKKRLTMGPSITHVGHDSPFVNRHHSNWRLKGLQAMESLSDSDLFYTGPMALSNSAAKEIRKLLIELVEKSTKKASTSDSETLRCLNIDWFPVR